MGASAFARPAHPPVRQTHCNSASHLNQVALGDAAMRLDCPRIASEPLSVAALARSGWRVQSAISFGDQTTNPRAGVFLLEGPKS